MTQIALVTGAASGIGLALAKSLATTGLHVIVSDLDVDAAMAASQILTEQGYSAESYRLDVSSQDNIDEVAGKFPQVDVLINNAGVQYVAKLEEFPADRWRLLTEILLIGPAMLTRAVLPGMKSRSFGRIINIGSIHSLVASPFKSAYVAAKHGIVGLAKVIALETADYDITVNTICPSYVKTPLVEKQVAQQAREHGISEDEVVNNIMLEPMPKKAFIEMKELAATVEFLLSDGAKNITGQNIVLDGGWTVK